MSKSNKLGGTETKMNAKQSRTGPPTDSQTRPPHHPARSVVVPSQQSPPLLHASIMRPPLPPADHPPRVAPKSTKGKEIVNVPNPRNETQEKAASDNRENEPLAAQQQIEEPTETTNRDTVLQEIQKLLQKVDQLKQSLPPEEQLQLPTFQSFVPQASSSSQVALIANSSNNEDKNDSSLPSQSPIARRTRSKRVEQISIEPTPAAPIARRVRAVAAAVVRAVPPDPNCNDCKLKFEPNAEVQSATLSTLTTAVEKLSSWIETLTRSTIMNRNNSCIFGIKEEEEEEKEEEEEPQPDHSMNPIHQNTQNPLSPQTKLSDIKRIVSINIMPYWYSCKADKQIFQNPDKRHMIQILRRIESVRLLLKNDTEMRFFGVIYPQPESIDVVLYCDNVTLTITQKQFNGLMKQSGFGQFKLPDSVEMYVKPTNGQRRPEPRKYVYLIEELNSEQNCSVSPYNVHSNNVHHLSHKSCHNKIGYRCIYEGCYLYFKLEDKLDAIEHVKDKHKHLLDDEPNCGGGGGPTKFLRQVGITDSEESVIGQILSAQPTDQQADKSLNANPCEHHLDCPYCEKVFYYYAHLRDHYEREHLDQENLRQAPATNMRASSCASSSALSANTSHHQQVNPNVDREFEYLDTLYQSLQLIELGIDECNSNNLALDGLSSSDEHRAHNTIGDSLIDSNFEQTHASTSSCVIMNGTTNPVPITTTIDRVQQTKQTNLSSQNEARKRQLQNDHDYCANHSSETSTNVNAAAGSTSSSSANASQAHVDKVVQQLVQSEVFTRSKRSKVSKIDNNVETLTTLTTESPTRDQFCFECHKWVEVPKSCSACQRSYHEECALKAHVFERQQIALEAYKNWKGRSNKDTGIATLESNLNVCNECVLPIVGEMFFRVNNASNEATLEQDLTAAFLCFARVLIKFCNNRKDPGDKVIIKRRISHHMIISPIDLIEIESKADQYKSIEHFMSDIKLLIHNRHIVAHHQRLDRSLSLANLMEHATSEAQLFHMCYSCRIMFHMECDEYKPPEIFPTEEKKTPFGVMFQIPCAFLHKVVWVQTNGSWLPAKVFQSYVEGDFEAEEDIYQVITFGFQQIMLAQASELFNFSKKPPGLNGGQWGNPHLAIQEAESYLNKIDSHWYENLPEIALPFDGELYMDPPQDADQLMEGHWKCANCSKILGPNDFRLDSCISSYCSTKCKDEFLGRV